MASIPVTNAWTDPSSSLTSGTTYVVQNRATGPVQFFEGPTFNAGTNDADGVILVALHDHGAGPNSMRWAYDATRQVRMRLTTPGFGNTDVVEFATAA